MAWTTNPKIYDEYMYMLERYSQYFSLFVHYSDTGKWTNDVHQSSGARWITPVSRSRRHTSTAPSSTG